MINAWHLLWIVPVSMIAGAVGLVALAWIAVWEADRDGRQ